MAAIYEVPDSARARASLDRIISQRGPPHHIAVDSSAKPKSYRREEPRWRSLITIRELQHVYRITATFGTQYSHGSIRAMSKDKFREFARGLGYLRYAVFPQILRSMTAELEAVLYDKHVTIPTVTSWSRSSYQPDGPWAIQPANPQDYQHRTAGTFPKPRTLPPLQQLALAATPDAFYTDYQIDSTIKLFYAP